MQDNMSGFSGGFAGSRRPDAPRGPPLPMHLMNMFASRTSSRLFLRQFSPCRQQVHATPPRRVHEAHPQEDFGTLLRSLKVSAASSARALASRRCSYVNLENFESREVWLQSRVKHRVPETRDQRYERVKKEREARGKQVGCDFIMPRCFYCYVISMCCLYLATSYVVAFCDVLCCLYFATSYVVCILRRLMLFVRGDVLCCLYCHASNHFICIICARLCMLRNLSSLIFLFLIVFLRFAACLSHLTHCSSWKSARSFSNRLKTPIARKIRLRHCS